MLYAQLIKRDFWKFQVIKNERESVGNKNDRERRNGLLSEKHISITSIYSY